MCEEPNSFRAKLHELGEFEDVAFNAGKLLSKGLFFTWRAALCRKRLH
jgi:hypothetical protein